MSQTLYRKYRPKNFSEVIGQTHIVRTLSNAIKNNRVGHAYLFTGPRGTGKTSIARILAKTINCENLKQAIPCEKCPSCETINSGKSLDIIEIDAASNTGVDNIRELRETVNIASSSLKYKVYIIDEVHMLSMGAFNALLKTLEEPPAHVVFVLATTEIHKVPETIISRCQRFDFTRLPLPDIIKKLSLIGAAEKVNIEKEALEMIAIAAEGGMRDAESMLGQIIALEDKNITAKEAEEILGTTDKKMVAEIATLIIEKNSAAAIAKINELLENGYDLQVFNKALINYLRQLMLIRISAELKKYFTYEMPREQLEKMSELAKKAELTEIISAINLLLEAQNKISSFILPQLPLEIAIIKATRTFPEKTIEYRAPNIKSEIKKENKNSELIIKPLNNETLKEVSDTAANLDLGLIKSSWNKLLTEVRPYNHSLSALLGSCQPIKIKGQEIFLATPYAFYQERLVEAKNKLTVEKVFGRILGTEIYINVEVDKNLTLKSEPKPNSQQNPLIDSALEIIGGRLIDDLPKRQEK